MRALIPLFIAFIFMNEGWAQTATSPFRFSAYADVYYGYDFSKPANNERLYVTQAARHNEFNLNWGYLLAEFESGRLRSNFGIHTGTYVQYNYAAEPNDLTRLIYLANAGVKLSEGVWIDAGVISPHTGYESVASLDNEMYTRALATEYTPYYLTGAKLSAKLSSQLDLTAVVVNGWQIIAETNDAKSFGLNLAYRPTDKLTLSYGNLFGNEAPVSVTEKKFRSYHNAWVRYNVGDRFHLVASGDYGSQELPDSGDQATFSIWMLIAGYAVSERLNVAARVENMQDMDELLVNTSGMGFDLHTYSFTGTYNVSEQAKVRIEAKYGQDAELIFRSKNTTLHDRYFLLVASLAVRFKR